MEKLNELDTAENEKLPRTIAFGLMATCSFLWMLRKTESRSAMDDGLMMV